MFLSRLNVSGFKSYTEPVVVDFDEKISVIIGSNGVGKSNALDAIAWALGEDDLTRLRCGDRKDLLFSGSEITPPVEEARVELTFSGNGTEILASRALTTSGKEEFLVQNESLGSASDYRATLANLGLGYARRNIVRQERLTDFFFKAAPDRRRYILRYVTADTEFDRINTLFQEYLDALIPGSYGRIFLDEIGEDADVEVTFPKKGAKRGVLLSGGERASTALALKLALFSMAPGPMYMLDEVEPSLDWTHNHNMQELLKKLAEHRQLIIVTHFQSTIRMARTVHGVRIRPDGSSWLKFHFVMDERLFKIYKCC
ncbi:AAA family ATPase [Desulfomonile tiedjei]|uniref:RecF/RecN/SMC N-terminal domain-containing protein n=1 Tax=Desulfomonile tiedjei (strain ATCC 49306 / DSM 6799 / DCB-1) TaxID=706587 RepID=I4C1Z7_DESTA|nr:AAA family ATPase [Desulfomonile tiedjei]AFM23588.1 RecF/RecN/SMC N-terminal domain-containing protein [Desulfomonile tiedjei DSM 6799]